MKKKIDFCEQNKEKLIRYLQKENIKYKLIGDDKLVPKMICFSCFDYELTNELVKLIKHEAIVSNFFSDEELLNASFLTLRPQNGCIEIVNEEEAFDFFCPIKSLFTNGKYRHKEQKADFVIANVSFPKTIFLLSEDSGKHYIFTRKETYDFLKKNKITGIVSRSVLQKQGNVLSESNLLQIGSDKKIPYKEIFCGENVKVKKCSFCGTYTINIMQDYQLMLKGKAQDYTDDFYQTEAVFGPGITKPLFVVSNKFYKLLVENKMNKGLTFEPVVFKEF